MTALDASWAAAAAALLRTERLGRTLPQPPAGTGALRLALACAPWRARRPFSLSRLEQLLDLVLMPPPGVPVTLAGARVHQV